MFSLFLLILLNTGSGEVEFESYKSNQEYYPTFVIRGVPNDACDDAIDHIQLYNRGNYSWYDANQVNYESDVNGTRFAWSYSKYFAPPLSIRIYKTNGEEMTFTNIIPYYSTNETFSTGKQWCDTPSTTMFWTTPPPTAAVHDESPAPTVNPTIVPTVNPLSTPTVNPTMEPTATSSLDIGALAPQRGKVTNYPTTSPSEWSEAGVSEKSNIFDTLAQNSWIIVVMVISVLVLCVLCLCGCLLYTLWRQNKQLRDSNQMSSVDTLYLLTSALCYLYIHRISVFFPFSNSWSIAIWTAS